MRPSKSQNISVTEISLMKKNKERKRWWEVFGNANKPIYVDVNLLTRLEQ